MKNKLRKIVVDNLEYLYLVSNRFHSETDMNTLTVKVFLTGYKQTPLIVQFLTLNDYSVEQPLKLGVKMMNKKTNSEHVVNLNKPGFIRQFILHGKQNGWSGTHTIGTQNGLSYLEELGFETDRLQP